MWHIDHGGDILGKNCATIGGCYLQQNTAHYLYDRSSRDVSNSNIAQNSSYRCCHLRQLADCSGLRHGECFRAPLRNRFGVVSHMEYYTVEELRTIILQSAQVLDVEIDEKGAYELARRSRGTPRLANRLLKRVRDFAQVKYDGKITYEGGGVCTGFLLEVVIRLGLESRTTGTLS